MVVDQGIHDCIIGWDALRKHRFSLDETNLYWGKRQIAYRPYSAPRTGICAVEGVVRQEEVTLQTLLRQYASLFGEPGTLAAAKVEPLRLQTTGPPVHTWMYRLPLKKLAIAD